MKIKDRQNEEDILEFLYLARFSYNQATKCNFWILILTIISFILIMLGIFWLQLVLLVIITILNIKKIKNIKIGADAKKYIDRTLFGLELKFDIGKKEYLKDKALKVIEKNKEDYELKKANNGYSNVRGIKDWYNVGNKEGIDAIYQCQRENLYWDKKLVVIYAVVLVLLFIVSLIALLLINKFSTRGVAEIISSYYNVLSTLALEIFGISSYIIYSARIDENRKSYENIKNLEDKEKQMLELQEKIEKRRKQPYTIPDVLHKIKSIEYHKRWKKCKNL